MAIRRIIDIELNDDPLKKFIAGLEQADAEVKSINLNAAKAATNINLSAKYSAEYLRVLREANGDHEKALELLGEHVEKEKQAAEEAKKRADEEARIAEEAKKVAARYDDFKKSMAAIGREWHGVVRDVKTFAEKIETATRSILKWSGIFGLASGVLGLGGLFGIERLAASTGASRRSSLGLGMSIGEHNAFGLNYGRLVDTEGFLGGVNESLHDPTKRGRLYNAGLSEGDIRGKDTAQVGDLLIGSLKRLADQTAQSNLGSVWQGRQLGQFMSLQDFERLKNTPAGEIEQYRKSLAQDIKNLELADKVAKAWQDLLVQLNRAGLVIENVLVKALTPLAEPLTHLSEALVKLVQDLSESGTFKKWVDGLVRGVQWLDKEFGSTEFHDAVQTFIKSVGDFGDKIKAMLPDLETFGAIIVKIVKAGAAVLGPPLVGRPADPDNPLPNDRTPGNVPGIPQFDWRDPTTYDLWQRLFQKSAFRTTSGAGGDPSLPGGGGGSASQAQLAGFIQSLGYTSDQSAGFLDNLTAESGLNPAAYNPAGGGYGAQGIAQWRGERVEQYIARYGHQPRYGSLDEQEDFIRFELNTTERAAAARLHAARDRYAATAAVNESYERSGVSSASRYGAAGAGAYSGHFDGSRGVTIKVENLTGGAVAISAAQLAV